MPEVKKTIELTQGQIANLLVFLDRVSVNPEGKRNETLKEVSALHEILVILSAAMIGVDTKEIKKPEK